MAEILPLVFQYVLPGTIVALIGGWFMLAQKRREKAGTDAAAQAARLEKQFPGWQELVDENRRLRDDLKTTDGKVDELDGKLTELRRADRYKMNAVARILRALFDQWPDDNPPNLDPADIAAIEETVPPAWVRKRA